MTAILHPRRGHAARRFPRALAALLLAVVVAGIGLAGTSAPVAADRCPVGQAVVPGTESCASVPAAPTRPAEPTGREAPEPAPEPRPQPTIPPEPIVPPVPAQAPAPSDPAAPVPAPSDAPDPTDPPGAPPETPVGVPVDVLVPDIQGQVGGPPPLALIQPLGPEESVTVTVAKSGCPVDIPPISSYDGQPADLVYDAFLGECTDPLPGTVFTLTDANGQNWTMPTADGPSPTASQVSWYGLPPGFVAPYEVVPPGYAVPVVFCTETVGDVAGPVFMPELDGGAVENVLDAGSGMVCHWFNIPAQGIAVIVAKWLCPPGVGPDTTGVHPDAVWGYYEQFFGDTCQDPGDGIPFTVQVDDPGFEAQVLVTDNGTATGVTGWPGVPTTVTIAEEPPLGYLPPYIDCSLDRAPGSPHANTRVSDYRADSTGEIAIEGVLDGDTITCAWYNTPPGDGGDPGGGGDPDGGGDPGDGPGDDSADDPEPNSDPTPTPSSDEPNPTPTPAEPKPTSKPGAPGSSDASPVVFTLPSTGAGHMATPREIGGSLATGLLTLALSLAGFTAHRRRR